MIITSFKPQSKFKWQGPNIVTILTAESNIFTTEQVGEVFARTSVTAEEVGITHTKAPQQQFQ